jgi:hypothetical protein
MKTKVTRDSLSVESSNETILLSINIKNFQKLNIMLSWIIIYCPNKPNKLLWMIKHIKLKKMDSSSRILTITFNHIPLITIKMDKIKIIY